MATMTRRCCVCGREIARIPCSPQNDGQETSGYCPVRLRETYLAFGLDVPRHVEDRVAAVASGATVAEGVA